MKGFLKFTYVLIPIIAILVVGCENDDSEGVFPENKLEILQGKWYRVGGNNPTNNGMEITVTDNNGKVTHSNNTEYPLNSIKWKDIIVTNVMNKYEYQELDTDGTYYNAFMELTQDDTLRVYIGNIGPGNEQKWVRTYTEPELNECIPYGPSLNSGLIIDEWSEPNENDFYPGLLPAVSDPAGGYYIVTLTSSDSTPWIEIKKSGDVVPIINGTGSTDSTERKVAFTAQPGISYDVMVKPFHNRGGWPETYSISWEYLGIMDCYEPNDTFVEAKFIPKNKTIEAFANRNNEGYNIQEKFKDYYKVVLEEPSKIQIELLQSPSDNFINIRLYEENQLHISSSTTPITGNNADRGALYVETSNQVLDAGVYYIEAYPYWAAFTTAVGLNNGEYLLDSWLTPYKFKVTTIKE